MSSELINPILPLPSKEQQIIQFAVLFNPHLTKKYHGRSYNRAEDKLNIVFSSHSQQSEVLLWIFHLRRRTSAAVPAIGIKIKPVKRGDKNPCPIEMIWSKLFNIAFAQAQSKPRLTAKNLQCQTIKMVYTKARSTMVHVVRMVPRFLPVQTLRHVSSTRTPSICHGKLFSVATYTP